MEEQDLPLCRYGENCYRKNAEHLKMFSHRSKTKNQKATTDKHLADADKTQDRNEMSPPPKKRKSDEKVVLNVAEDKSAKNEKEKCDRPTTAIAGNQISGPKSRLIDDCKTFIKDHFLFDMPPDFYDLWTLAESLKPDDPCRAFEDFLNVVLCGPFDVMAGKFDSCTGLTSEDVLLHCRYYYDVPEFQTVMRNADDENSLFHIGYLRDDAENNSFLVCSNDGTDCKMNIIGDNLFAALKQIASASSKEKSSKTLKAIEEQAEKHGYSLEKSSKTVKDRKKKVVAATFHGAGIVVPMSGDVGYRPLSVTDDKLKKMLKKIDEDKTDGESREMNQLQELITYVQFANDECDFGMGYELGIDLFCSGYESFHSHVRQLLSVAYTLLQCEPFTKILETHLGRRIRGQPFMLS